MTAVNTQDLINKRYQLHDLLGAGGMGAVYRATDRLNGQMVALKQISQLTYDLEHDTRLALSLAQEFKTLAGLRHPHIVAVLDYGFDALYRPFFTMDYLQGSKNLRDAGQGQPQSVRLEFLLQLLQALAYLHRQGVIHADLKPDNVLVVDGQVQVLDFGLAVNARLAPAETGGTLAYMAPELFDDVPHSRGSDLYAVGVMAYELLTGRFPFDKSSTDRLLMSILMTTPDFENTGLATPLVRVLVRLMAREPGERFGSAEEAIATLSAAAGQPLPAETAEIRESYLQAAQFVGREAEMAALGAALDQLLDGRGSAWLVGGESGVGKSRMLDEFRTQALVEGVTVLGGQAVEAGGRPYELWRDILAWLALTADLSLEDAAILKPYVAGLERLLGQPVPDPPPLDPEMSQNRLFRVVEALVRTQERPVLLILEDLHWAGGLSRALLAHLQQMTTERPLLLIGNYRDDEQPALPDLLPGVKLLPLKRLTTESISELSSAMLGQAGRDSRLVARLQQETEGNPFFLVEVVRALAETTGRLAAVEQATLPGQILTGGIAAIINRRLDKVPAAARPLLNLAAVAGRELDLRLLGALAPEAVLDAWLNDCVAAAVLEVQGERWRFTHDKLREGALAALDQEARPAMHRQVAVGLESLYGAAPEQLGALLHHWAMAGDVDKERYYAQLAGEQAAAQYAGDEALRLFGRALALTPETDTESRYQLLLAREAVYDVQGNRQGQQADLNQAAALVAARQRADELVEVALRRARLANATSDYRQAITFAQAAVAQAQAMGAPGQEAAAQLAWGVALSWQNDYGPAAEHLTQALSLARASGQRKLAGESLRRLGRVAELQGNYPEAIEYYEQSLAMAQELEDRRMESHTLTNMGSVVKEQGRLPEAVACFEQSLAICREIGDRRGEGAALAFLGYHYLHQGDTPQAAPYFEQGLVIFREIGDRQKEGDMLLQLGNIVTHEGRYAEGAAYYQQSLDIAREIGDKMWEGHALAFLGWKPFYRGDFDQAAAHFEQGVITFREIGIRKDESTHLTNLANTVSLQGDYSRARDCYEQSLVICREIGDRNGQGYAFTGLGDVLASLGEYDEALLMLSQAAALRRELGQNHVLMESLALQARVFLLQNRPRQALDGSTELLAYVAEGGKFEATEFGLRNYLICYRLLQANADPRALPTLATLYALLQQKAGRIPDEAARRDFLEKVPWHREIVAEWEKLHKQA